MGLGNYITLMKAMMRATSSAAKAEACLTSPRIKDLGKMGEMYQLFSEALLRRENDANPKGHMERRKFLLIAAFFFSPEALAGRKMRQGVRDTMASVTGITPQLVCRQFRQALFYYETYMDFKRSVDVLLEDILSLLPV